MEKYFLKAVQVKWPILSDIIQATMGKYKFPTANVSFTIKNFDDGIANLVCGGLQPYEDNDATKDASMVKNYMICVDQEFKEVILLPHRNATSSPVSLERLFLEQTLADRWMNDVRYLIIFQTEGTAMRVSFIPFGERGLVQHFQEKTDKAGQNLEEQLHAALASGEIQDHNINKH